jgi:hypothetical protein
MKKASFPPSTLLPLFSWLFVDVCRAPTGALWRMADTPSPALLIIASKICLPVKGFPTASYLSRVPPLTRKLLAAVEEMSWRRLGKEVTYRMFMLRALISLGKNAMEFFGKKRSEEWLTPQIYTGKSMCEMGTCDCPTNPDCICCDETLVHKPTDWEQRWMERLREKEEQEPEFVTKRKQEMIRLIEAGRGNEIVYDEWGEAHYSVDPEKK